VSPQLPEVAPLMDGIRGNGQRAVAQRDGLRCGKGRCRVEGDASGAFIGCEEQAASRRLHEASVPVPGVVWTVQFEAAPYRHSLLSQQGRES
jgi:hypothetical protein